MNDHTYRAVYVKERFWTYKLCIDTFLVLLALPVVVTSDYTTSFDHSCEGVCALGLVLFKYFALVFDIGLLLVEYVIVVELAWVVRNGVVRQAYYLGTSAHVPVASFQDTWFGASIPTVPRRLLGGFLNGVYFLTLPATRGFRFSGEEFWQWIAFIPSIILSLLLFVLTYALILEAQSFLEVFFTILAVQVYSEVGGKVVTQLLERTLTVGQRFDKYTEEASGNARILKLILSKLYYDRTLVVDMGKEPYQSLEVVDIPLRMVVQSLQHEVQHPVEITFRNCRGRLSATANSKRMGMMQSENNRNVVALLSELQRRRVNRIGSPKLYLERQEYHSLRREFERQYKPKLAAFFSDDDDMVNILEQEIEQEDSTLDETSSYNGDEVDSIV